jgi:uncharacterized protein YuzE
MVLVNISIRGKILGTNFKNATEKLPLPFKHVAQARK